MSTGERVTMSELVANKVWQDISSDEGLSMAFSFAVAALIEGKIDAAWGRWVRPWTLAAWIFLTIGIIWV